MRTVNGFTYDLRGRKEIVILSACAVPGSIRTASQSFADASISSSNDPESAKALAFARVLGSDTYLVPSLSMTKIICAIELAQATRASLWDFPLDFRRLYFSETNDSAWKMCTNVA